MSKEPYIHVAHKDGKFVGAISDKIGIPTEEKGWRKEVAKFCGGFIADGFQITTLYSKEEYQAFTADMPMWEPPNQLEKQLDLLV